MNMSENDIKIRFEFTDGFGNCFTQESKFEVFPDMGETIVDCIGEKLNVFLKQAGFCRKNDLIFMEDVSDDEYDALSACLDSLREGK